MAESQHAFNYAEPQEAAIRKSLTEPRLGKYLARGGFQFPFAMQWYLWNARLAKAFQFPLQVAEVTVRNAIVEHLRLTGAPAEWAFDKATVDRLEQRDAGIRENLNRSKRQLLWKALSDLEFEAVKAIPETEDIPEFGRIGTHDVVANMSLDFWVRLLGPQFEPDWQRTLRAVFPNANLQVSRRSIWRSAMRIKDFRNRVAHHEPVFHLADLQDLHSEMIQLTGLRCATTKAWLQHFSTFQAVFRQAPAGTRQPWDEPIGPMLHAVLEVTDASAPLKNIIGPLSAPGTWGLLRQNGQITVFGTPEIARWLAAWTELGVADLEEPLSVVLERSEPRHRTFAVPPATTVAEAGARFFARNVPTKVKPTALLVTSDGSVDGQPIGILFKDDIRTRR